MKTVARTRRTPANIAFAAVAGLAVAAACAELTPTAGTAAPPSDTATQPSARVTAVIAFLSVNGQEGSGRVGGCGATVVDANSLLTAAHCVLTPFPPATDTDTPRPVDPAGVTARLGSASRTHGGVLRTVTAVTIDLQFQFSPAPAHDLALLRVELAVPTTAIAELGSATPGTSTLAMTWSTARQPQHDRLTLPDTADLGTVPIIEPQNCPQLKNSSDLCFAASPSIGGVGSAGSGLFRIDSDNTIRLVGVISRGGSSADTTGIATPVLPSMTWIRPAPTSATPGPRS